jgi:hypothetical protein
VSFNLLKPVLSSENDEGSIIGSNEDAVLAIFLRDTFLDSAKNPFGAS